MKSYYLFTVLFMLCCAEFVSSKPSKPQIEEDTEPPGYDDIEEEDNPSEEDENTNPLPPILLSEPLNISALVGKTAYLPCTVENAEDFSRMWYKNKILMYQDNFAAQGEKNHHHLFKNGTIRITHLQPSDTDQYVCNISSTPPIQLIHHLNVLSPPKINTLLPEGGSIMVDLNAVVTLECGATGHPKPTVVWSKGGKRLGNKNKKAIGNSKLQLEKVTLSDAGTYQCVADNGVGNPAHGHITVHVPHAPIIRVEKNIISVAEGYNVVMKCSVQAYPIAIVEWYKDNLRIENRPGFNVSQDHKHNSLEISKVAKEDFGIYRCNAYNPVGTTHKDIKIAGEPGPVEFVQVRSAEDGRSPILTWTVESHYPMAEYMLQYKKNGENNNWITAKDVKVEDPIANTKYKAEYELHNLSPGGYLARVRARNTFGWSQFSPEKDFDGEFAPMEPVPENIKNSAAHPRFSALYIIAAIVFVRLN